MSIVSQLSILGRTLGAVVAIAALFTTPVHAENWSPYPVQVWDPPFNMASPRSEIQYEALDKAEKPWEICVSFPHMKDAY